MEFWTLVRFSLYPVMLVSGLTWALLMLRHYRRQRCAEAAWAFWLGLAVAVQGLAGFAALVISRTLGFGPLSSAVFTIGPLAVTLVMATGAVTLLRAAWRRGGGKRRQLLFDPAAAGHDAPGDDQQGDDDEER